MTRFKLYTEDKNREAVKLAVNKYFTGYTLLEGLGVWGGHEEPSLVFEFIEQEETKNLEFLRAICESIKKTNKQEKVLVTAERLQGVYYV